MRKILTVFLMGLLLAACQPIAIPVTTVLPTPSQEPALPLPTATAPPLQAGIERVSFAPGAISAARQGVLSPGALQQYVLRAAAGQKLVIQVNGFQAPVNLAVTGPDGVQHPVRQEGSEIYIFISEVLPTQAGDYTVALHTPTARVTTDFEVYFEITKSSP